MRFELLLKVIDQWTAPLKKGSKSVREVGASSATAAKGIKGASAALEHLPRSARGIGGIIKSARDLGRAFKHEVKLGIQDALREMDKLQAEQSKIDQAARRSESMRKARKRLRDAEKQPRSLLSTIAAAGGAYYAGRALGAAIRSPFTFGRYAIGQYREIAELQDRAAALGVTNEQYQLLTYTYERHNLAADKLKDSLSSLAKSQVDAKMGGLLPMKAYAALGVSIAGKSGLKALPDLLKEVADGYSKITNPARRARIAQILFGESGDDLDRLLRQGSKGLSAYDAEARSSGNVFSAQDLAAAAEFNREWTAFSLSVRGFRNTALSGALPIMRQLVAAGKAWVTANRVKINTGITTFFEQVKKDGPEIIKNVKGVGNALADIDWESLAKGINTVAGALNFLVNGPGGGDSAFWSRPVFDKDAQRRWDESHGRVSGTGGTRPIPTGPASPSVPKAAAIKGDIRIHIDQDGRARVTETRSSSPDFSLAHDRGLMSFGF